MVKDKVLSMLGLAAKAGKIVSGEFSTESAIKEKKAFLVIVAGDASDNTKKNFRNMTTFYKVDFYTYSTKDNLGACIGKQFRSSLAITDENFAKAVKDKLDVAIEE